MHDYLLSTEWVRFAFVLGIATSMVLYERRHLTTGSIVVPGYIAVFLIHPLVIAATFLNAFATYALVNKVLRRYVLLYGRTKFTVLAVLSTLIQAGMLQLSPSAPWLWERDIPVFVGAGFIVPALIAHDMARQGIATTTKSVLLAGTIVAIPITLAVVLDLPGANDLAPVSGFGTLAFPVQWLPIAVVASIVASWAVAYNYGFRSGGFIGATFLGMFIADPWQVAVALGIAGVSYLVVAKILMHHMILFGRRKFSAMLLTSSAIAWPALWLGNWILPVELSQHLAVGSLALTPLLLPGLVANDIQRTSPRRVAAGVAIASLSSVTWTWWIGATVTGQQLALGWKILAVTMAAVLAGPQLVRMTSRSAEWVALQLERYEGLRLTRSLDDATTWRARRVVVEATMRAVAERATARTIGAVRAMVASVSQLGRPRQLAFAEVLPSGSTGETQQHEPGSSPSWRAWVSAYPQEADDATAWLDEVLAVSTPTSHRRDEFTAASVSMLTDSLQRVGAPSSILSRATERTDQLRANMLPAGPGRTDQLRANMLPAGPGRTDQLRANMLPRVPLAEPMVARRSVTRPIVDDDRNPAFERAVRALVEERIG